MVIQEHKENNKDMEVILNQLRYEVTSIKTDLMTVFENIDNLNQSLVNLHHSMKGLNQDA